MGYSIEDDALEGRQERQEQTVGRRQLLKVLIAAGGAVTTSAVLSSKWIRPIVEAGVLPSHAQVTHTPTPSLTPSILPTCYTPTPARLPCYTPTAPPPTTASLSPITQQSRRSLLEQLLAEERFPPDVARELG
jgi:hypothetical protein